MPHVINKIATALGLLVFLASQAAAQEARRQIVPLRSTRADVEKILGATEDQSAVVSYDLPEGKAFVIYSVGGCDQGWQLPKDVVYSYHIHLSMKPTFSSLKLPRKQLKKLPRDSHLPSIEYYKNEETGILYEVQGGKVFSIEYGPTRKDRALYYGCQAN